MTHLFTLATAALTLALSAGGDLPTRLDATAPRAVVASTLTVTSLQCYDVGGGGKYYNNTECYASASGGTGAYTWEWDVIVTSGNENSPYISGVCTDSYPVTVTVRDSSGATASLSRTFVCYAKSTGGGGLEP